MSKDDDDWVNRVPIKRSRAQLKIKAHRIFDPLWQSREVSSRGEAYLLLAEMLRVPVGQAHMKHMTTENLLKVPAAVKAIRVKLRAERNHK